MNFYQMNNLKIIFFGTPDFSLDTLKYLHNSNHKLISVVSSTDKKSGRGLKIKYSPVKNYCIQNQISLLQPENLKCIDFQNDLKNLKADLYVIVAFKFLPKEVWSIPKMGSINIHASLLPNLRGAAPINWSLIYGHNKTGLTSFFLDEKIDTGDIILKTEVIINHSDNFESLYNKLKSMSGSFLSATIEAIINKKKLLKQKNILKIDKAPKLNKENTRIKWNDTSLNIYNHIRGLTPFPGAWTEIKENSKKVIIYKTEISDFEKDGIAGSLSVRNKSLFVNTSDRLLKINELKIEGKKIIKGNDFINSVQGKEIILY